MFDTVLSFCNRRIFDQWGANYHQHIFTCICYVTFGSKFIEMLRVAIGYPLGVSLRIIQFVTSFARALQATKTVYDRVNHFHHQTRLPARPSVF